MSIVLILFAITGCSNSPSNKEATDLAYSYLSDFTPGIEKNEINILKSYEKEANTIVVVQAGGMLCEMPVIKGKDGWIGRGISCNGQFESPEKAEARRKKVKIAAMIKGVEDLNKKCPFINERNKNVRHDKFEFDKTTNTVRRYETYLDIKYADVTQQYIKQEEERVLLDACNDSTLLKDINDVSMEIDVKGNDGKPFIKHIISKDTCAKYYKN